MCKEVGIPLESCRARLLPQEKLDWILQAENSNKRVLMIGDGINDAAALAGEFCVCMCVVFSCCLLLVALLMVSIARDVFLWRIHCSFPHLFVLHVVKFVIYFLS